MKAITNGWVVVNYNHPSTGNSSICESTFSRTRKEAIEKFTQGSNQQWKYWYRKYNFRCVRAKSVITIHTP